MKTPEEARAIIDARLPALAAAPDRWAVQVHQLAAKPTTKQIRRMIRALRPEPPR